MKINFINRVLFQVIAFLVCISNQCFAAHPLDEKITLEIKSITQVQGYLYLVVLITNKENEPLNLNLSQINDISDGIKVSKSDGSHAWGNLSSSAVIGEKDIFSLTLGGLKSTLYLLPAPPSSLFATRDFDEKIKFSHSLIKAESTFFHVKRKDGTDYIIVNEK